jgi:hypothetical protein
MDFFRLLNHAVNAIAAIKGTIDNIASLCLVFELVSELGIEGMLTSGKL